MRSCVGSDFKNLCEHNTKFSKKTTLAIMSFIKQTNNNNKKNISIVTSGQVKKLNSSVTAKGNIQFIFCLQSEKKFCKCHHKDCLLTKKKPVAKVNTRQHPMSSIHSQGRNYVVVYIRTVNHS